jgi:carbamoyl-phosphate synthase large subunit
VEQLREPVSQNDAKYQIYHQSCPITNYEPMPRRQDLKKILLIGSGPIAKLCEKKVMK